MSKKIQNENIYKNLINISKIPLLPLDNRWHQLFPNGEKGTYIKKLEDEVMRLIKEESKVSHELKDLLILKKKLMSEIMQNMEESDDDNESVRQKKLEVSEKFIMDINAKLENLKGENKQLPRKLIKANEQLLYASIDVCYNRIQENSAQIKILDDWIGRTREELKKNIGIKQDKEDMNAKVYTYMHDMLGHEFMEIFDKNHNMDI